jgi:hypothetical protein
LFILGVNLDGLCEQFPRAALVPALAGGDALLDEFSGERERIP